MKKLSIGLAIGGLTLAALLVGWYGFAPIATSLLSVGGGGFLLFCVWQFVTMTVLGLCWRAVAGSNAPGRILPFVWGRVVRDSAASCLPFSMVGGFVFGVRAATLHGISASVASFSLVVDLTAEFVAEILFAVAGLLILLAHTTDPSLARPIIFGIALALATGALVLQLRKSTAPLLLRFGRGVLHRLLAAEHQADGERADLELAAMYSHTGRMALCTAGHVGGWLCKGVGNWIAFRLLGSEIDLATGLAIEALLHALLIPAFVVPGYAGVQEAGYAAVGALFGVPSEISLSVSLLRRARDIALGVPVLLVWQLLEVRRLRQRG